MSKYILAGNRPGWDFTGCTRIDRPPNKAGFRYTEFRKSDGTCHAIVLTELLTIRDVKASG